MEHKEIIKQIQKTAKILHREMMCTAKSGMISIRDKGKIFFTMPHAFFPGLKETDIRFTTESEKTQNLSSEEFPPDLAIHLSLYQKHPELGAILHAFPQSAGSLAIAGLDIQTHYQTDSLEMLGNVIPILQYAAEKTPRRLRILTEAFTKDHAQAVLMQNDGCWTCGQNLEEALARMELVETSAKMNLVLAAFEPESLASLSPVSAVTAKRKKSSTECSCSDHSHLSGTSKTCSGKTSRKKNQAK